MDLVDAAVWPQATVSSSDAVGLLSSAPRHLVYLPLSTYIDQELH